MAAVDHAVADGRRRPRPPRRRRLELRRHPDRLRDREDDALQGRDLRRQHRQLPRRLRHRPLPVRVRGGAGPALEDPRPLAGASRRPSSTSRRSTTPTLFLCGALDVNVPLLNSEQLYQALRRVGRVETELVIYPDQWHSIETPELPEGPLRAVPRLVRPLPAPGRRRAADRKPEATSLLGRPLYAPDVPEETRKGLEEKLAQATAELREEPGQRRRRDRASADATPPSASTARRSTSTRGPWPGTRGTRGSTGTAATATSRSASSTRRWPTSRGPPTSSPGRPDEPEPDSDPSRPPSTTLQFSVFYHLGLAHYLKGDFAAAEKAYRRCLERARGSDDRLVSATDWLYMTLRRQGRAEEAARLLEPIHAGLPSRRTART